MDTIRKFRLKAFSILILTGAVLLLTACSEIIPFIPNTGLDALRPTEPWQRIGMGILGGILLISGFALGKIFIQLLGFLGGGLLGIYLLQLIQPTFSHSEIVGFFVGGILGLGFTLTATGFGVFIAGAFTGAGLAQQLWPYIENHEAPWPGLIIAAVIGGLLTLWLFNFWIAALTSALGAILAGMALNLKPIYWLIFLAGGILVQTLLTHTGSLQKNLKSEKT